ncbi:GAF domain-containing sensor histidine kinase [Arthrobacter halodurans]|uniref:Sensor-like histidine kinase SenX3 n=1 Tax=Arthrobacter halodurans TaxID=516699 RepID=A0ABV4UQ02_9MICC
MSARDEALRQEVLAAYGLPHGSAGSAGATGAGDRAGADATSDVGSLEQLRSLTATAAAACGTPIAVLNIITVDEQHQVAAHGVDASVCSREDSMCAHVFRAPDATVVPDASADARFAANPHVTGELAAIRFYASVPLLAPGGVALGSLCVFSEETGALDAAQRRVLEGIAEHVVDVLDLQLRTRQLETALQEIRTSNGRLAEFAGRVSHDLRTALTSVLGYVELGEDASAAGDAAAPGYLRIAGASGRRMLRMIDDVLDYSTVGGALRNSEVRLSRLVGEVSEDLAALLATSGAIVECADAAVPGDAGQLRALLQNLVCNAVAYRVPGTVPVVAVSGGTTATHAFLEVADNGPGIPPADRGRVVEPLVRLGRAGDPPGTGLGLATCARIAAAHGGALEIGDAPDGGATVTVRWPLPDPSATDAPGAGGARSGRRGVPCVAS